MRCQCAYSQCWGNGLGSATTFTTNWWLSPRHYKKRSKASTRLDWAIMSCQVWEGYPLHISHVSVQHWHMQSFLQVFLHAWTWMIWKGSLRYSYIFLVWSPSVQIIVQFLHFLIVYCWCWLQDYFKEYSCHTIYNPILMQDWVKAKRTWLARRNDALMLPIRTAPIHQQDLLGNGSCYMNTN